MVKHTQTIRRQTEIDCSIHYMLSQILILKDLLGKRRSKYFKKETLCFPNIKTSLNKYRRLSLCVEIIL